MGQNVRGAKSPDTLRRLDDKNERLGLGLATHIRIFNNGTIKIKLGHTDASRAQWIDCGKLLSLGSNKPGKQTVHGLKCHLEKNATIFRYFDGIPSTRTTYKKGETRRGIGGWLGGWMYGKEVRKTLYYQVTFVFVFSAGNECPFSFSFRFRP